MRNKINIFHHKPEVLILYSFLLFAVLGAFLLKLPIASTKGALSWIDAFFMSTSAVCVTGLSTVDVGTQLTVFGQIVILCLIQIGGLGIMTFSLLFLIFLGKQISLPFQLCLPDLSQEISFKNIRYAIASIFMMTITFELVGMIVLFCAIKNHHTVLFALYSALFHSVSAFCNAGFSLYADSFMHFNTNPYIMCTLMGLIIPGGLGFIVIYEILRIAVNQKRGKGKMGMSFHTKIALMGSAVFIGGGTLIIWIFERGACLRGMSLPNQFFNALFLSVTSRTAGFNTLDTSLLSNPTLLILLFCMFVGGCPGSTAGGIKLHTFFSLLALVKDKLRGLQMASLFKRKIPDAVLVRAFTIFVSALLIIFAAVLFLQLSENASVSHLFVGEREEFFDTLFEAVSAFGTVGLSTGTTPYLSFLGKIIIIMLMFIGRVGILTLGIALQMKQKEKILYEFPQEEILVS